MKTAAVILLVLWSLAMLAWGWMHESTPTVGAGLGIMVAALIVQSLKGDKAGRRDSEPRRW